MSRPDTFTFPGTLRTLEVQAALLGLSKACTDVRGDWLDGAGVMVPKG